MRQSEVIDLLEDAVVLLKGEGDCDDLVSAGRYAIAVIQGGRADKSQEWIPCSERLPNKDGRYLVCMDIVQDNIDVLRWADGWNCFRDFDGNVHRKSELDRDTIIAWMPLPKPWEGESDD